MLELRVLGYPQALYAGAVLHFKTRKSLALLVYLALEPRAHGRAHLMGLLWRDSQASGRGSLRTALTHLNATLAPSGVRVIGDVSTVWLSGEVNVDLGDGVLLEGFAFSDAPEFEDWIGERREQMRTERAAVLRQAWEAALRAGDLNFALTLARQRLALEPLDEALHQALIGLHLERGEREAAVTAMGVLLDVLQRELGSQPSAATLALQRSLESNREALQAARASVLRGLADEALVLLLERASRQWQSGMIGDAAALLEGALGIGLQPSDRAAVLTRLTVLRAELGQDALVAVTFKELVGGSSSAAQRAEALSGLAMSLVAQGRLGDAERAAREATTLLADSSDGRLIGEVAFRSMLVQWQRGEFALVEGFLAALMHGLEQQGLEQQGLERQAAGSLLGQMAFVDVSVLRALALLGLDRADEARALLEAAKASSDGFALGALPRDHVALGWLLYHRATGTQPEALGSVEAALSKGGMHFAEFARAELIHALLEADHRESTLEQIQIAVAGGHPLGRCMGLAALARLQWRLGADATATLAQARVALEGLDSLSVQACVALALLECGDLGQRQYGWALLRDLEPSRLPRQWRFTAARLE